MKSLAAFALLAAMPTPLSAAIIISGDVTTPSAPVTLTITTDITFSIDTAPVDEVVVFLFKDFVTSGAIRNLVPMDTPFIYTLNGNVPTVGSESTFVDNWALEDLNEFTANSGYIYFKTPAYLNVGDILTIKAGTYTFQGQTDLNPGICANLHG